MTPYKSEDYKIYAVQYYLSKNKTQIQTCEIFQSHPRSLMLWVDKRQQKKTKKTTTKKTKKTTTKIKKNYL